MKYRLNFSLWLFIILSLSIVPIIGVHLLTSRFFAVFMSLLAIFFMTIPFYLEKTFHLKFPQGFLIILLLFLYASVFLGTANDFYAYFWWWDKMLHGFSGFIFAYMGYLIHHYLDPNFSLNSLSRKVLAALFAFSFALAAGGVWEIYEYTIDSFFGTQYQGVGIHDTMQDIIMDTLGAVAFSILVLKGDPFPAIKKVSKKYKKHSLKTVEKNTGK
ncbi:MAG: hypothetical protein GX958_12740 [Desulfitobacterium sp.]|nr:hypothetical protein [Desulfitobacterium sp.]